MTKQEFILLSRLVYQLEEYHLVDHPSRQENCAICLALWEAEQAAKEEFHE